MNLTLNRKLLVVVVSKEKEGRKPATINSVTTDNL